MRVNSRSKFTRCVDAGGLRSLIEISASFYWHKGVFQKIKYQLGKPYLTIEVINYLILGIGVVMTFIVRSHHQLAPSSSGLGLRLFTPATGVRVP